MIFLIFLCGTKSNAHIAKLHCKSLNFHASILVFTSVWPVNRYKSLTGVTFSYIVESAKTGFFYHTLKGPKSKVATFFAGNNKKIKMAMLRHKDYSYNKNGIPTAGFTIMVMLNERCFAFTIFRYGVFE